MSTKRSNVPSILGAVLLIGLGILILLGQLFERFDFWDTFWPFILIGIGALFFAGMLTGGKSSAGLAIPGSILACLGLMMFLQNLFDRWESWSYSWTVIIFSVGLGIYIKGVYGEQESSRQSGWRLMRLAVILFVIFGIFFEMIFNFGDKANYVLPIALILVGLYLLLRRTGRAPEQVAVVSRPAVTPPEAEITPGSETPSQEQ